MPLCSGGCTIEDVWLKTLIVLLVQIGKQILIFELIIFELANLYFLPLTYFRISKYALTFNDKYSKHPKHVITIYTSKSHNVFYLILFSIQMM